MSDNADINFLISCLHHTGPVTEWKSIAEDNGIAGSAALTAAVVTFVLY